MGQTSKEVATHGNGNKFLNPERGSIFLKSHLKHIVGDIEPPSGFEFFSHFPWVTTSFEVLPMAIILKPLWGFSAALRLIINNIEYE